jgi:hypothetical protein
MSDGSVRQSDLFARSQIRLVQHVKKRLVPDRSKQIHVVAASAPPAPTGIAPRTAPTKAKATPLPSCSLELPLPIAEAAAAVAVLQQRLAAQRDASELRDAVAMLNSERAELTALVAETFGGETIQAWVADITTNDHVQ